MSGAYHGARLLMGAIFIYASYDKILHPEAFARAVYNYQILPDILVNLAAMVLPWLELAVGLLLVANRWVPGAAIFTTGLMGFFLAALVFNQVRGLNVHCGCFSTQSAEGSADWWTVARDSVFLGISAFLFRQVLRVQPSGKTGSVDGKNDSMPV
ncbi:MAG: DoxX family membrane protein [Desulfobacterales bacterium]|nr:DoxX family membrane protein [Desulfobacterales bacterium]